jgi:alpha-mannosidase
MPPGRLFPDAPPTPHYRTMKYEDLLILLPCHSLEDFPTHHSGDEAAGLLAGWSALWHPALIASTQKMPSWFRADSPPDAYE